MKQYILVDHDYGQTFLCKNKEQLDKLLNPECDPNEIEVFEIEGDSVVIQKMRLTLVAELSPETAEIRGE